MIQVKGSLMLPEQIDQRLALCQEHKTPTVCFNVTVCFSVKSRQFKGAIGIVKTSAEYIRLYVQSADSFNFRLK